MRKSEVLTSEIGMTEFEPGTAFRNPCLWGQQLEWMGGLSISSCRGHGVERACSPGAQKKVNSGPVTGVKPWMKGPLQLEQVRVPASATAAGSQPIGPVCLEVSGWSQVRILTCQLQWDCRSQDNKTTCLDIGSVQCRNLHHPQVWWWEWRITVYIIYWQTGLGGKEEAQDPGMDWGPVPIVKGFASVGLLKMNLCICLLARMKLN